MANVPKRLVGVLAALVLGSACALPARDVPPTVRPKSEELEPPTARPLPGASRGAPAAAEPVAKAPPRDGGVAPVAATPPPPKASGRRTPAENPPVPPPPLGGLPPPTPPSPPPALKPAAPALSEAKPGTGSTLDLKSLEQRLKDSHAIGVLTKLALKNQVDDLIERFKAYHAGHRPPTLPELRKPYELLLMKLLSLLQDGDPSLAQALNESKEAIWGILSDRSKFTQYA